jgi:non-ribosomal peptide synthetase component F
MRLNAAQLLIGGHDARRPALVCGDRRLDYGDLRERVGRAAAVWRQRGLTPGDRVAICLPDGIEWVCAFLGTIWAGGVAVGVNPRIAADDWAYVLAESGFASSLPSRSTCCHRPIGAAMSTGGLVPSWMRRFPRRRACWTMSSPRLDLVGRPGA